MRSTRSLALAGLLIAAGIVAGIIFHALGIGGQIALPLHYPALLAGLLLGWKWGFAVGLIVPVLSALLTGMPPLIPSAILMVPELAVYGACCGLLRKLIGIYPALITSLIFGRVAWGIAAWVLIPLLGLEIPVIAAVIAAIVKGLPGIVGQLILVPLMVSRLEKIYDICLPEQRKPPKRRGFSHNG